MKYFLVYSDSKLDNEKKIFEDYYCLSEEDLCLYKHKGEFIIISEINKSDVATLQSEYNKFFELKPNCFYDDLVSVKKFKNMYLQSITEDCYIFICGDFKLKVVKDKCKINLVP